MHYATFEEKFIDILSIHTEQMNYVEQKLEFLYFQITLEAYFANN